MYHFKFAQPDNYLCVVCREAITRPSQLPCGHLVCVRCIQNLRQAGKCPMTDHEENDDVIVTQDTVFFFDKNVGKVINRQPDSCPCCDKDMQYKEFSLHIKTYPQLPVSCKHDGCQAVFDNALTLTTHMSTCGYKPKPCH